MTFSWITVDIADRIGTITLNRPDKRNALNAEMVSELKTAFSDLATDDAAKVIVLKANGKAFSAGADLAYLQQLQENSYEENLADSTHLMELFELIYTHPKIVLAQVEGPAIAGGCGLATVCDFVFAVPEVHFGFSEVRIGFIPAIVMVFLIRKVDESKAKELLLTGSRIITEQAHKIGLVNYIYSPVSIEEAVRKFASKLVNKCSGDALRLTKEMIGNVQAMPVDRALRYAAEQNAKARSTDDCKKGIAAFLNKEDISW